MVDVVKELKRFTELWEFVDFGAKLDVGGNLRANCKISCQPPNWMPFKETISPRQLKETNWMVSKECIHHQLQVRRYVR